MSSSTKRLLPSLYFTFLFLYLMSPLGATFNGVIVPDTHLFSFVLLGISVGLWLWIRIRRRWSWHRTAFDFIFILWGVAFVVSVLANWETVRRSVIGLWYMLAYIGVWYILHDILSNRGISRKLLVDALLNAGTLVILFSFIQLANQKTFSAPVSIIGNPNALGAILLGLTPFAVQRAVSANHKAGRIGWGLYSIVVIVNLLLTLSRGAWLGMFTALGLLIILLLRHHEMLSVSRLKSWWQQLPILYRRFSMLIILMVLVVSIIAGALLINSFSISARRPELRTRLWNSALVQFAEKPITGQGFYTFGRDYGLSISIPPEQSHAHAHSVPLNIMAEMGLIGLGAFIITGMSVFRLILHRWQEVDGEERLIWIPSIATLVGFGVHHLFDLPSMMPVVALVGLLVLVTVCDPFDPEPVDNKLIDENKPESQPAVWFNRLPTIGMIVVLAGLFVSGLWSSGVYQDYLNAMRISFRQSDERTDTEVLDDYRKTVNLLDGVIAQDPLMPIYHQQQAFVWGLIAESGDNEAIQNGIKVYQQFLSLEPNHAISWANLSALQWQSGDSDSATQSIDRAIQLAPSYQLFQKNLQLYNGDIERDTTDVPRYIYNQNFARFEFLREPLNTTFLPQVGWGSNLNN